MVLSKIKSDVYWVLCDGKRLKIHASQLQPAPASTHSKTHPAGHDDNVQPSQRGNSCAHPPSHTSCHHGTTSPTGNNDKLPTGGSNRPLPADHHVNDEQSCSTNGYRDEAQRCSTFTNSSDGEQPQANKEEGGTMENNGHPGENKTNYNRNDARRASIGKASSSSHHRNLPTRCECPPLYCLTSLAKERSPCTAS